MNELASVGETQAGLRELALFAGAGGGILGGKLLGWRTVCAVEFDEYARDVLIARQNDGCLEPFPIWDDVRTFDGNPWRGIVDVVSGGFPCQDISAAGRGAGITGGRSGLWTHMARIIGEVRPRFAFVENSPMLTRRGLGTVLEDLASMGYDARWGVLGAHHAGAPHKRDRIWILAYANNLNGDDGGCGAGAVCRFGPKKTKVSGCEDVADAVCSGLQGHGPEFKLGEPVKKGEAGWCGDVSDPICERQQGSRESWYSSDPAEDCEGETDHALNERLKGIWGIESKLGRVANGVANRTHRLRCIGNGQVPVVAALAWNTLMNNP